jgi:uncharacterized C2H2 Zn-finger protein
MINNRRLFRDPYKHVNKTELEYRLSPYRAVNTPDRVLKINHLVLCGEIIAVCSELHTKHVNKAESYYRLRPYRAENTVQCIYVS